MTFQPHFPRIVALSIASLLFVIAVAAVHPVCATTLKGETPAERYVLEQLQMGLLADFGRVVENERQLSASFIARLLTSRDTHLKTPSLGIWIEDAVITGELDLAGQEIPYHVILGNCRFLNSANFRGSHFAEGLTVSGSTFEDLADFSDATIHDFFVDRCRFTRAAAFRDLRVANDFNISDSTFDTVETSFESARVAGAFTADNSKFGSAIVSFDNMRVDGNFSAKSCVFANYVVTDRDREGPDKFEDEDVQELMRLMRESKVSFVSAHFADFSLNDSSFEKISTIDFTRMQADLISFDGVSFITPSEIKLQGMAFKLASPVNAEQQQFLVPHYNAEYYSNLETSWRTHGYPDEADKIFVAKKRAERRENCKSFLHQCRRPAWAWSLFQDTLLGYGKSLQNLLYWSVGFLIIGTFVFRSEKGMRIEDPKDAPHHTGRYNAFWYSLDLFLPIIKLGEAEVWTPKDDRRWANLYRKVHIIIGSLFVPIGLAAWTGIIK
jgi:hypothetical protein